MISEPAKKGRSIARQKKGKIRAQSQFFRTARYGLTLQEHRIVYYAILRGQQEHKPFEPVTLAVKDFMELCDLKGGSTYSTLRNISKKLLSRTLEFIYHDENGDHFIQTTWLSNVIYHAKAGTVEITPNKTLKKMFEEKPYTETEFYYLVMFTSQYAERLYELLKSFDFKSLTDFDIEDLRARLAIPPKQYPNYADLSRRVLTPAIKDINEFTDLDVSIHEKRGAKNKVVSVLFTVEKKSVPPLYERVKAGDFSPPLSEAEQELVIQELIDGDSVLTLDGVPLDDPSQLSISGVVVPAKDTAL